MRRQRRVWSRDSRARSAGDQSAVFHSGRRGYLVPACVLLVAVAGLVGSATPALAITLGHTFAFQFGSLGSGNGQLQAEGYGLNIGVDQSSGDVYVADSGNARIEKFDAAGNFLEAWGYGVSDGNEMSEVCTAPSTCHRGLPGAAPGQFEWPNGIAVDNSGGPNNRDVYVVDNSSPFNSGREAILKFSPTGIYLGTIDGSESPTGKFGFAAAATVDSEGFLWVTTASNTMEFANDAENEYISGSEWEGGGYSIGINQSRSKLFIDNHQVVTNGTNPQPPYTDGFGTTVNHANGDVFAFFYDTGTAEIQEYTEAGLPVGPPFSSHTFPYYCVGLGQGGSAVNESTNTVYEIDPCNAKVFAFVPRVVPDTTTGPATNIDHASATLTGETAPDPSGGGSVSNCHFELGTSTSYGTSVPCAQATPYSSPTAVTADVSGLTMDTTYHYRLVAANSVDANKGADQTFTPRRVLGLTTNGPTEIGLTSAKLNASFDPAGLDTHYFFEWGPTQAYGNTTAAPPGVDAGSGSGSTDVSAALSGLASYAKYHYRIAASNSLGTSYGNDEILRTIPPSPPTVAEPAASNITDGAAHLSAAINPNHGTTVYKFQYGVDETYGRDTPVSEALPEDETVHPAGADISGLQAGTVYHFRVIAINLGGTSAGPDKTFATAAPPGIESEFSSGVGPSAATLVALVNPELRATTVHFEYGPTAGYGRTTPETAPIGSDRTGQLVSAEIGGLAAGTTYHFRVVATNGIGVTYGNDQTVATAAAPGLIQSPPKTTCRKGFVMKHGECVRKPKHKKHQHRQKRRHGANRGDG